MSDSTSRPPGTMSRVLQWAGWKRQQPPHPARSADEWNQEYASGRWDYLEGTSELARHSVLVGYLDHLGVTQRVLDVGCGMGVLFPKLRLSGCTRYVGVDLSSQAIGSAVARYPDPRATFVAADGQEYLPDGQFDAVIFNEVLYFFREPELTVARYANCLQESGLILVSTCTAFRGGEAILDRLRASHTIVDETRITANRQSWSWIVSVFKPTRGQT
jgi:2-polyprenyl-3-methyl-5-hydroxy-6-metoxy-1,4-benzoquinol methylase